MQISTIKRGYLVWLIISLCFFNFASVYAKKKLSDKDRQKIEEKFNGIWQMGYFSGVDKYGEAVYKMLPFWKIFDKENQTFENWRLDKKTNKLVLNMGGKFEITSKKEYYEIIDKSAFPDFKQGDDVPLMYKFENHKVLITSFFLGNRKKLINEKWIRVKKIEF